MLALGAAAAGRWQLDRADQNRALRDRFAAAVELPPLDLAAVPAELDEALRYRRVRVTGAYAPERQFLLDNRVQGGVVGYEVLTPFRPRGAGRWLLVNRGWVRADPDRRVLPSVAVDDGERVVVGMLDRLPRPGLRLGDEAPVGPSSEPLAVLQYPTAEEIEARLGRPLADLQLVLEPDEPDGYLRRRDPPGLPPERNLAYAGQWFALAALCAAGAVWGVVAARRRRTA